ncbi:hypothetical protein LINGRAHAP2_LOCUS3311 [Linum grandiflorum]
MSLPLSMGFSKLTSVVLNDVLLCMDFFEIFLPQCPLLQELNLFDCCIADSEPPSLEPLLFPSSLRSISITFSIWLPRHNGFFFGKFQPDMVALFASLPALEQLNLDLGFLLFLSGSNNVPYQLPALVHNLTILKIPHILLGRLKESSVLACLIKSSPNLRKLTIGLNHEDQFRREFADEYDPDRISDDLLGDGLHKLLEPEDYRRVCCLQHLEELNISNMCGNRVELELVRFLPEKQGTVTAEKLRDTATVEGDGTGSRGWSGFRWGFKALNGVGVPVERGGEAPRYGDGGGRWDRK